MKYAIFVNGVLSDNKGGPNGYVYNLKTGLHIIGKEVKIFSKKDIIKINVNGDNKSHYKNFPLFLLEIRMSISYLFKGLKIKKDFGKEIHQFDLIHAHSCEDVFALKKLSHYKGKIVLTPHKPETLYNEVISTAQIQYSTNYTFPVLRRILIHIEKVAYKLADGFIFPSVNSKKIYENFPGFKKYAENKPCEYVYTGTKDNLELVETGKYRQQVDLDRYARLMSYIGRHNLIKGYDLLVNDNDFFEANKINVICAGACSTITPPNTNNWSEMGYISDAYNLISDSDVVVIPNRSTYFDLIIIEILSLGVPIITSNTGGNIDIAEKTSGLMLFDTGNKASLNECLQDFFALSASEREKMKLANRSFYLDYCTLPKFAGNYYNSINRLCKQLMK